MSLTGPQHGPGLGPPAALVARLDSLADRLAAASAAQGRAIEVDPLTLLTERAAIGGLARRGRTSCGGGTRLLAVADGWLAVSLPRPDDVDLVPAWLRHDGPVDPGDPWAVVQRVVADRPGAPLVERAALLGLPVGLLPGGAGEADAADAADAVREAGEPAREEGGTPGAPGDPVGVEELGAHPAAGSLDGVVVAELGSLWAAPLCGALLADAGAQVIKVESTSRPDGARRGPAALFDLLNAGKRSVALDPATSPGRRALHDLLAAVDVVIEGSRPRALEQMGIDALTLLDGDGPRVWASITAHGREGAGRDRVGFGDDVAVAAGLVARDAGGPWFCADAVADPCTGLAAAVAVLESLAAGRRCLLDVPMAAVAAHLAGPTLAVPAGTVAAEPRRRPPRGTAPALGADTAAVLAELGVGV
jgi:hypothetical protein